MQPLWQVILLTVGFMACQDSFATGLMISEARNLPWIPGALDAANTWVGRAGTALTAVAATRYGLFDWHTQAILGATMATDFCTTNTVTPLWSRLLPQGQDRVGPGGIGHIIERLDALEAKEKTAA